MKPLYVYDKSLLEYRFNDQHPFNQMRVKMTTDLLASSEFLKEEDIIKPRKATDEELLLVHQPDYVEAVKKAGEGTLPESQMESYGLASDDTPTFDDMHEKSKMLVGATLTAVDEVMKGNAKKVLSLAGGLHHGFTGRASGFCIYNDSAVAIEYMRKNYGLKVLYIDTDAHHGDGVQFTFYNTNEVMTYSIHETGRYLFPGTGSTTERGDDSGFGFSVNLPVDAFTEDESFLSIFEESLENAIIKFKPDILLSQNGVDAHYRDPMTHLALTSKSYEEIPRIVNRLSDEYTDGKWIAVGGGGYNIWQVVPRMWAQIWLAMNDETAPRGALPAAFLEKYQPKSKVEFPTLWEDDLSDFQEIPRQNDITEKNEGMLQRILMYLEQI
ncbi:MAG TPA: acetoin utilization protein AcuC [Candidatus Salinicoccus merdavium]|nr:acetoin utilization protein AcuC [Candidatus Salinicoccus merdavium]